MSMLSIILEPDPDGTLHLPVPAELRFGKVKVVATLESVESGRQKSSFKVGCLKGFNIAPDFDAPLEEFRPYME